ncbi:hypothetical protein E2C01_066674 [Portunus trituberculatus]|uniref:Uncharacterized protein n=1 Tax=Portunus trituberculatus TaxID=210409 RepID=A0A5B7HIS1_PORTR|nr:hypothetical protein [Portunus trituberculatus]
MEACGRAVGVRSHHGIMSGTCSSITDDWPLAGVLEGGGQRVPDTARSCYIIYFANLSLSTQGKTCNPGDAWQTVRW